MPKILRVVIDTNHIISAILSARGASAKLIDWMTRDEDYFHLLLSEPIWQEYTTVAEWLIPLSRHCEKERIIRILSRQAVWIEPNIRLEVCADKSDNRFLECAVAGNADYLVTKNIRHFPHKTYGKIKIVRIKKFLNVLEKLA
ncbi:putative toxin-antitoxin system toxin component, PIN family [bacterium]|nr:putative toxin-antitoxin system toxin component, PIN family [bacterium]